MRHLLWITTLALLADGAHAQDDVTWASLRDAYDADGNGAISLAEYGRDAEQFANLDIDGDEVITERDFEGPGRGSRRGATRDTEAGRGPDDSRDSGRDARRSLAAPAIDSRTLAALVFRSTQEARAQELPAQTLRDGFARVDTDGDGRWSRAEFEAGAGNDPSQSIRGLRRGDDRFAALLAGVDVDRDTFVTRAELDALFAALDLDGDAIWTSDDRRTWRGDEYPPRDVTDEQASTHRDDGRAATGVTAGANAVDFTLTPLHGGDPVTLSSFAGDRPVALVFGSYT